MEEKPFTNKKRKSSSKNSQGMPNGFKIRGKKGDGEREKNITSKASHLHQMGIKKAWKIKEKDKWRNEGGTRGEWRLVNANV